MEEAFNKFVTHVFNNWVSLKLAVDHSLGGRNSKQVALDCLTEVKNYCLHNDNIDQYDIWYFLDDIMDEKFHIVPDSEKFKGYSAESKDYSTKEIGLTLYKFLQLLRTGDQEACENEYQRLQTANFNWLQNTRKETSMREMNDSSSEDSDENTTETPMEDDGWTVVKSRRLQNTRTETSMCEMNNSSSEDSDENTTETPMEDDGWTVVKSRRKC